MEFFRSLLKPDSFPSTFLGTAEAMPFQNKTFPYSEMRLPC
jgi:hypothetical protein